MEEATSNLNKSTKPASKANIKPSINPFANIETKLNSMYSHASGISQANLDGVKASLTNFLNGQDIDLKFSFGPQSKVNETIIRGLMNIYINTTDLNLQVRAKKIVKNALNPLYNPPLALKIIATYNDSKFNKFPIKKIDSTVKWALEKGFEMYFDYFWDLWMKKNIGPDNTFITGNFIGLVYDSLTGKGGTRSNSWFGPYYNGIKENPEKFQPAKPAAANNNIDRSSQTISDIIKKVYNPGGKFNPQTADAFNNANKEILDFLKKSFKNPAVWKVFEYTVINKLDTEEILQMDKKDFPTSAKITGTFRDLATKYPKITTAIDNIYKKYKLNLPPFSNWKTMDLTKGPSDRGELKPDNSEVGRDEDGNLAKIKYDKFGDKTFSSLQEFRLFIRNEFIKQLNN